MRKQEKGVICFYTRPVKTSIILKHNSTYEATLESVYWGSTYHKITLLLLDPFIRQSQLISVLRDYLDPFLSLVIVIIICFSTWPLFRDSTLILLNSIPPNINVIDLEERLLSTVKGVASIHELHVWRLVGT